MRRCFVPAGMLWLVAWGAAANDEAAPPAGGIVAPRFTDEERAFWAFQPVADPPVPSVKNAAWPRSAIDRFIRAELEALGLSPAPAADRRTLIRRATFDLIGLPPTPDEVAAFLADESPDAFARVIDRLLASPYYGQRYARHWLDVARYADSNGLDENLAYANAWRYRDYVVAAFNRDKPFDRFLHEQLAGDLLPDPANLDETLERTIATGFLSLGGKMLAEDDPVKMQMDIIDEQVDTIGRAFLGLTLGCARCHAHKFDPIPIEDYYALAGIFKSTRTMDNFSVVARWQERALAAPEVVEKRDAQAKSIAARKAEVAAVVDAADAALVGDARRHLGTYLLAAAAQQRLDDLVDQASALGGKPESNSLPGLVLVEAEDFARGNVLKDRDNYGKEIGVLVNKGEQPNFVEYDVTVGSAGVYQCELRYAAAAARPCALSINGRLVKTDAAARVTGTWSPDSQTWFVEGFFPLKAGLNVVRLEHPINFPHIDKLLLAPARAVKGTPVVLPTPRAAPADGYEPKPEIVQQLTAYMEKTRSDAGSVFAVWREFASPLVRKKTQEGVPSDAPTPPRADAAREESAASGAFRTALLADLRPESLPELAARYEKLFLDAESSETSKAHDRGEEHEQAPVPIGEALRRVLLEKEGPFAIPKSAHEHYPAPVVADLKAKRDELKSLEDQLPVLPETMAVSDDKPQNLRVHLRGSHLTLGDEVPRFFPRILAGESPTPLDERQSGRLQFARWLTAPENPLTRRVIVNRVWQWHLGEGLVRSPDNFGRLGERPSHPALLDHLAAQLARRGWSLKDLHREIMLSATYQMNTAYDERAAAVDPENRLLWRANRRRLEAEAIRDAILAVAGTLNPQMEGTLLTTANRQYVTSTASVNPVIYETTRRSIYLPVVRSALYDVFQAFDFADPSTLNGKRDSTTVAPQALFILNSDFVLKQTRSLAARLLADDSLDDAARVQRLYEHALSRPPRDVEIARGLAFTIRYSQAAGATGVGSEEARHRAWQALCRTILASNEFVYVE